MLYRTLLPLIALAATTLATPIPSHDSGISGMSSTSSQDPAQNLPQDPAQNLPQTPASNIHASSLSGSTGGTSGSQNTFASSPPPRVSANRVTDANASDLPAAGTPTRSTGMPRDDSGRSLNSVVSSTSTTSSLGPPAQIVRGPTSNTSKTPGKE